MLPVADPAPELALVPEPPPPQFVEAGEMRDVRSTKAIGLALITHADNPREVFNKLAFEEYGGYSLINPRNPAKSVLHIVRHNDLEVIHDFCRQFYLHEMNVDDPKECNVNLAESMAVKQIEPVAVRRIGGHAGHGSTYSLIAGGRRTLARAFLYAMSRLAHSAPIGPDGYSWPGSIKKYAVRLLEKLANEKPVAPEIECQIFAISKTEAFDIAVRENKGRKDFNPIEDSRIYNHYLELENPQEAGKKFNLRTLSIYLGEDYQHVRGRHALDLHLTDEEKEKVVRKEWNLTNAIQLALSRKLNKKEPKGKKVKTHKRNNGCNLKEMQQLFDETNRQKVTRLQAIADCMKITFEDAIEQSDDRVSVRKGKRGQPRKNG